MTTDNAESLDKLRKMSRDYQATQMTTAGALAYHKDFVSVSPFRNGGQAITGLFVTETT
jgi:hypothetical protein